MLGRMVNAIAFDAPRLGAWIGGAVLLALAGLYLAARVREARLLRARPPPGRLVGGAPGRRIHLIERPGADPAVVFIHGNPGCSLDFVHLQERLAGRRRTFSVDRPGSGWSERERAPLTPQAQARRIRAALHAAGAREVVLAGFSFGGPVSVAYALEFPDEVRALALLAPVGDPHSPMEMDAAQAMLAWPLWGWMASWTFAPAVFPAAARGGWVKAFAPLPVVAAAAANASPLIGRPLCLWATAADWAALPAALPELAQGYGRIRAPVEILAAGEDHVVPAAHPRALAAGIPGANLTVIPGAGHQVMHTHPDEVLAAIERALARA